ncbi:MAG: hypothetical protein ACK6DP_20010 [Gemmatimonas sp.]|jgi:hypothetical protein|uniref:hypothetical protein n=1 Tax=Gemmatimonas sp. TaxID=1962908 RepID=UPI00391F9DEE
MDALRGFSTMLTRPWDMAGRCPPAFDRVPDGPADTACRLLAQAAVVVGQPARC